MIAFSCEGHFKALEKLVGDVVLSLGATFKIVFGGYALLIVGAPQAVKAPWATLMIKGPLLWNVGLWFFLGLPGSACVEASPGI